MFTGVAGEIKRVVLNYAILSTEPANRITTSIYMTEKLVWWGTLVLR